MAQNQPQRGGLRWVKSLANAALATPPIVPKVALSNNTLAIFSGDLLKAETGGTVYPAAATETSAFVAVSVANYLGADGLTRPGAYLPAATTYTGVVSSTNPKASVLLCIPVDGQVFEVDVPTACATETAATALIGQAVDIVATAGSTANGQSGFTTDTVANFAATTNSAQLRLVEIPRYSLSGQSNNPTVAYWKGWFVVQEQLTLV